VVLMAPSDQPELERALDFALSQEHPNAIRYPRDNVPPTPLKPAADSPEWAITRTGGVSRVLQEGTDAWLVAYGALAWQALDAARCLANEGLSVGVIDARFCKPLDQAMLQRVFAAGKPILTVEDHSFLNGFGTAVVELAAEKRYDTRLVTRLGLPDRFIKHASRGEQLAQVGLDPAGIARSVRAAIEEHLKSQITTMPVEAVATTRVAAPLRR
jgi:1-deoxy-D-xylulose-5-phosphate synthase